MPRTVDRLTFDELMLEHLVPAQRFAIRLTGDVDAAEDVVQTALVRAARSWQTFGGRSTFRSWLFQIVVNACRDRRSCRPSPGPLPEGLADARARDPAAAIAGADEGRLIGSLVSSLPERQREVLVLHAYEGLSTREVAGVLDVSEQNVRTNLHLARRRLSELLAPHIAELNRE
jgi:RNA polymerase sigma-70 factor (ECF subfamily)